MEGFNRLLCKVEKEGRREGEGERRDSSKFSLLDPLSRMAEELGKSRGVVDQELQRCFGVLGKEKTESLLQSHSVTGILVIRRKSGRMGRMGRIAERVCFFEGVDSLSLRTEVEH